MTDKELLLLAGKVAGLGTPEYCSTKFWPVEGLHFKEQGFPQSTWNPLTDAGDRYRLAKKLDIRIHFGQNYVSYIAGNICGVIRWPEDVPDDAYAIVLAASRIGAAL